MTINVMTESKAIEKTCCSDPVSGMTCIGSGCMAWRFIPLQTDEPGFLDAVKSLQGKHPETGHSVTHAQACAYIMKNREKFAKKYGLKTEPYLGFCGLAGTWKTGSAP